MNPQRPSPPSRRDGGRMRTAAAPALAHPEGRSPTRLEQHRFLPSAFRWPQVSGFRLRSRRFHPTPNSTFRTWKSDQVRVSQTFEIMSQTQNRKIAQRPDIPRGGDSLSPSAIGGKGWKRLPAGGFGRPARTWRSHSVLRPVLRLAAPKPSGGGSLGKGGPVLRPAHRSQAEEGTLAKEGLRNETLEPFYPAASDEWHLTLNLTRAAFFLAPVTRRRLSEARRGCLVQSRGSVSPFTLQCFNPTMKSTKRTQFQNSISTLKSVVSAYSALFALKKRTQFYPHIPRGRDSLSPVRPLDFQTGSHRFG